jgi:hypothetical protein
LDWMLSFLENITCSHELMRSDTYLIQERPA